MLFPMEELKNHRNTAVRLTMQAWITPFSQNGQPTSAQIGYEIRTARMMNEISAILS
jgi:hypothetical protein